jgi:hypothetical protein
LCFTEDGLGAFDQFEIQFFVEFSFPFQELQQYLMVYGVLGEELFSGERTLVGQGDRVDLAVFGRVLQLHKQI